MTESEVKEQADILRNEAKTILRELFQIPSGFEVSEINSLIDCIINAATLEIAILIKKTMLKH